MSSRRGRGRFITFEGIDGSGKTTQINLLARYLRRRRLPVVVTREPGGTRLADRIREIVLSRSSTGMEATTELLLYFAARAENTSKVIRPALLQGKIVISDRFTDASLAYQGYGRQLGTTIVRRLHEFCCRELTPDLTLVLEIAPQTGVERARRRNSRHGTDESRLEQEAFEFYQRVWRGYRTLARREPRRVRLVPAESRASVVHQAVLAEVQPLLGRYLRSSRR